MNLYTVQARDNCVAFLNVVVNPNVTVMARYNTEVKSFAVIGCVE